MVLRAVRMPWGQQKQPAHLSLQLQADELVCLSETWMQGFTLSCYHGQSVQRNSHFLTLISSQKPWCWRRSMLLMVSGSTWSASRLYQSCGSWTITQGAVISLKPEIHMLSRHQWSFFFFKLFAMFQVWSRTSIQGDLNSQKCLIQIYFVLLLKWIDLLMALRTANDLIRKRKSDW